MKILDPYTIVWVVRKQENLVTFSGPYYTESARTVAHNNGDIIYYTLQIDHNPYSCFGSNPEDRIKEASDAEVFTSFKRAMKQFKDLRCDNTDSIKRCIQESSKWYREGKEKQNKKVCVPQDEEESNSVEDFKK